VLFDVEITSTAEADIAEIWDYIAQDNPENASVFIFAIEEQIASLEAFPERCARIAENAILGTAYRHILHGPYRTIFRITGNTVLILRVMHSSRLLETELFAI
jgi:toxin ParE1/3/4